MTPDRAKYILDNRLLGGEFRYAFRQRVGSQWVYPGGITEDEHAAVKALWETMPGDTSFYDAVVRISRSSEDDKADADAAAIEDHKEMVDSVLSRGGFLDEMMDERDNRGKE